MGSATLRAIRIGRALVLLSVPTTDRAPLPLPQGLTPAERDVALLAAAGLSNGVIARQRGCRSRTVANQLAAAYRKLGINGRRELRARFTAAGPDARRAGRGAPRGRGPVQRRDRAPAGLLFSHGGESAGGGAPQAGDQRPPGAAGAVRKWVDGGELSTADLWAGVIAGTWSLLRHFRLDDRWYFVARRNERARAPARALTAREQRAWASAETGHSNKQIAGDLGVSMSAVATYLARARRKRDGQASLVLLRFLQSGPTGTSGSKPDRRFMTGKIAILAGCTAATPRRPSGLGARGG